MKAFVINLKRNPERRAFMAEQLTRLGIEYEFFEAVVGAERCGDPRWNDPERSRREISRELRPGEVGCALSHAAVYREIAERGLPWALVLEDDAILHEDVPSVLRALEGGGLRQGDIVFLERCDYVLPGSSRRLLGRYRIARPVLVKVGSVAQAAGYVVTLEAARRMRDRNVPAHLPADTWDLYSGIVNFRGITPTLTLIRQKVAFGSTTLDKRIRPEFKRHNLFMILGYGFFMFNPLGKAMRRALKKRGLMR
jgi:glycosyl transferase family 25